MKTDFCVIIPDRGDRPEFLEHCLFQMDRQTIKPKKIYLEDYTPKSASFDLTERVINGITRAQIDNIDHCYIIENDDYYPDNYFEQMSFDKFDFIGIGYTIYYHLFLKKYTLLFHAHQARSSLFCTGFKISALSNFNWPPDNHVFLDLRLWRYANRSDVKLNEINPMPIGIKHGIGLCGGMGHKSDAIRYKYADPYMEWLEKHTRKESFDFYQSLIKKHGT
jgi:hypothetical protein